MTFSRSTIVSETGREVASRSEATADDTPHKEPPTKSCNKPPSTRSCLCSSANGPPATPQTSWRLFSTNHKTRRVGCEPMLATATASGFSPRSCDISTRPLWIEGTRTTAPRLITSGTTMMPAPIPPRPTIIMRTHTPSRLLRRTRAPDLAIRMVLGHDGGRRSGRMCVSTRSLRCRLIGSGLHILTMVVARGEG